MTRPLHPPQRATAARNGSYHQPATVSYYDAGLGLPRRAVLLLGLIIFAVFMFIGAIADTRGSACDDLPAVVVTATPKGVTDVGSNRGNVGP